MPDFRHAPLGDAVRQRGLRYSPQSMQAEQARALESALWGALRSLEEQADLYVRMSERARGPSSSRYERRAADVARQADRIRQAIAELGRT